MKVKELVVASDLLARREKLGLLIGAAINDYTNLSFSGRRSNGEEVLILNHLFVNWKESFVHMVEAEIDRIDDKLRLFGIELDEGPS